MLKGNWSCWRLPGRQTPADDVVNAHKTRHAPLPAVTITFSFFTAVVRQEWTSGGGGRGGKVFWGEQCTFHQSVSTSEQFSVTKIIARSIASKLLFLISRVFYYPDAGLAV